MLLNITHGDITQLDVDAVIVNLFEGVKTPGGATGYVDKACRGLISDLIQDGELSGKSGEIVLIHTLNMYKDFKPRRVLIAGLGPIETFNTDTVRSVAANTLRCLRAISVKKVATIVHGAGIGQLNTEHSTQALVEGIIGGLYRFSSFNNKSDEQNPNPESVQIVEIDKQKIPSLTNALNQGCIFAHARNLARDLVNMPPNHLSPTLMAETSQELEKKNTQTWLVK